MEVSSAPVGVVQFSFRCDLISIMCVGDDTFARGVALHPPRTTSYFIAFSDSSHIAIGLYFSVNL